MTPPRGGGSWDRAPKKNFAKQKIFWEKGEQVLSLQRHGVALTTCELGSGALFAPFPDRARVLPREKSRRKWRGDDGRHPPHYAPCGDEATPSVAFGDSSLREGAKGVPKFRQRLPQSCCRHSSDNAPPSRAVETALGQEISPQWEISKLAGGQSPTGALARKRLLTLKKEPIM